MQRASKVFKSAAAKCTRKLYAYRLIGKLDARQSTMTSAVVGIVIGGERFGWIVRVSSNCFTFAFKMQIFFNNIIMYCNVNVFEVWWRVTTDWLISAAREYAQPRIRRVPFVEGYQNETHFLSWEQWCDFSRQILLIMLFDDFRVFSNFAFVE